MILPPSFIRIGFGGDPDGLGLWLPFFLLWPLFLIIFVLAIVVAFIADLVTYLAGAEYHSYTRFLLACCGLLNAVRGTSVFVHSDDTTIDFKLI